jgi:dipeptidyl aminopeptidase/acylaminoacyl peptidase
MVKRTILIILFLIFSCNAYSQEACKLLVQIDSDLWLVDIDGRPIHRLTYDGILKTAAIWSPDGQYIAYSPGTQIGDEKSIIIIDNRGQEVSRIVVDPKGSEAPIRYIDRIIWEKPDILLSDSNAGPQGGFIDIWKLDPLLHYSHKKRIEVHGWGCELSPNEKYVACVLETLENEKSVSFLMIYDTSKKRRPEDDFFFDNNPHSLKLEQIERVDRVTFTPDSTGVIIIGSDRKYRFNMRDNKLSEIKELPRGIKIKKLPETVKTKKDRELYQAEVFDMYCD